MNLRELRTLTILAETGSIIKAARGLHLSGPAIHKQLKTLEAELGIRLYEREGRTLRLTQAADLLVPFARDLVAQHDAALSTIDEWRGLKRGLVRIGAGPNIASYILPVMLKRFCRSYPSIDIAVETGNSAMLTQELRNGAVDLALVVTAPALEDPVFRIEASWDVEYVLVSNMRSVPRECSIKDLSRFPFIHFPRGTRTETLIDHYFAEMRFRPFVTMTFDNAEAIKAVIRNGPGIAMLPYWIVDSELRKRQLRIIHQKERRLFLRLDLMSRRSGYVPPPIAAFAELAQEFQCSNPRFLAPERSSLRTGRGSPKSVKALRE